MWGCVESCKYTMQAELRHAELKKLGLEGKIVLIGKKGITYFNRRTGKYDIVGEPLSTMCGRTMYSLCLTVCMAALPRQLGRQMLPTTSDSFHNLWQLHELL